MDMTSNPMNAAIGMIPSITAVTNARTTRRHVGLVWRVNPQRLTAHPLCNLSANPWSHYSSEWVGPDDIDCKKCRKILDSQLAEKVK